MWRGVTKKDCGREESRILVEEVGVALGTMRRFWNRRNMKKIEQLKLENQKTHLLHSSLPSSFILFLLRSSFIFRLLLRRHSNSCRHFAALCCSVITSPLHKNVDTTDVGGPRGIKKKDCLCKSKKRPISWVEKMARKRKVNQSQKMRKSAKKMQPLALDCSSISPSQDHRIGNASQHRTAYQQGAASQHGTTHQHGAASQHGIAY
ncbi:hypothetical protein P8452_51620 [Trifolium repens]|nr:hypothetical protein P8452_51620 [Trifolium repens]